MAINWTQADVDALKAAIVSGVLTVNYAGPPARSVTYQSASAMMQALALAQRGVSGGGTPYRLVTTSKGLGK